MREMKEDAYKPKGFDCGGCPVLADAVHRWRKGPQTGDYSAFVKAHYAREARLADGLVISMATGEPLTDEELARADLYEIAVMYDDGVVSKVWNEPKVVKTAYSSADNLARIAKRRAMFPPLPDNPARYRAPEPCKRCGERERYFRSNACCECEKRTMQAYAKR